MTSFAVGLYAKIPSFPTSAAYPIHLPCPSLADALVWNLSWSNAKKVMRLMNHRALTLIAVFGLLPHVAAFSIVPNSIAKDQLNILTLSCNGPGTKQLKLQHVYRLLVNKSPRVVTLPRQGHHGQKLWLSRQAALSTLTKTYGEVVKYNTSLRLPPMGPPGSPS